MIARALDFLHTNASTVKGALGTTAAFAGAAVPTMTAIEWLQVASILSGMLLCWITIFEHLRKK
jgi:hypothetical protein